MHSLLLSIKNSCWEGISTIRKETELQWKAGELDKRPVGPYPNAGDKDAEADAEAEAEAPENYWQLLCQRRSLQEYEEYDWEVRYPDAAGCGSCRGRDSCNGRGRCQDLEQT
jgi:hypothetical protein